MEQSTKSDVVEKEEMEEMIGLTLHLKYLAPLFLCFSRELELQNEGCCAPCFPRVC